MHVARIGKQKKLVPKDLLDAVLRLQHRFSKAQTAVCYSEWPSSKDSVTQKLDYEDF